MSKLKLVNITKNYKAGTTVVQALKKISLEFRESEFVSILGPSGCGKTTMLNIIGGLDRYDEGDLFINNESTKNFKDKDWDVYRNQSIGFVFQNYNLIGHQSVLQNVEIAMTLSGVSASERKRRATQALASVDLADQLHKKPNQLSGGQMQRVAIARALVNNPDIILADEPTGALDSKTSIQIMDILKEISKTRLVIMVTHNGEMAEAYSSRVIRLLDGEVKSDTHPLSDAESKATKGLGREGKKKKKTAMSLMTAISLSFKNLLTKKGRTIITALAGSIGIIGVALVLALSNGLSTYMNDMQAAALSGLPLSITTGEQMADLAQGPPSIIREDEPVELEKFTANDVLYPYDSSEGKQTHKNVLTPEFLDYVEAIETVLPGTVNTISYTKGTQMNVLAKGEEGIVKYETTVPMSASVMMAAAREQITGDNNIFWQEMPDNEAFITSLYDLVGEDSYLPKEKHEIAIVVDEYNRLDEAMLEKMGIVTKDETYESTDFIGKTLLKVVPNNDFYTEYNGGFIPASSGDYGALYDKDTGIELKITGILRPKDNESDGYLSTGLVYTKALTDHVVVDAHGSTIAEAQSTSDNNVLTNTPFKTEAEKEQVLIALGSNTESTGISIYPTDFTSKEAIKDYLDTYNIDRNEADQITYTDLAEMVSGMMNTLLDTITYVLAGFAAISLLVSTIMIGIITYVSVIERTKEIGILRSVGGRKKDISRVFNAETLIVGFTAGILGVGISYLLTIPINMVIENLVGVADVANLNPVAALALIVGSMALTLIAGLIPARMAAKKDPVKALRSE